jgi:ribosomal protein L29
MTKNSNKQSTPEVKLHDMSVAELEVKARQLTMEINKKGLEKAVGRLKNLREIFILRKEVARIKTIIAVKSESKP